jgi:hypothetical protein
VGVSSWLSPLHGIIASQVDWIAIVVLFIHATAWDSGTFDIRDFSHLVDAYASTYRIVDIDVPLVFKTNQRIFENTGMLKEWYSWEHNTLYSAV